MGGLGGMPAAMTPQMKSQIEIFVGNIPVGTTQQGLVDFLNAAMLKVCIMYHTRQQRIESARHLALACFRGCVLRV